MAAGIPPGTAKAGTGDITGVTAGDGLSGGGDSGGVSLAVDFNELTGATLAQADSIVFIDADDDGSKKEAFTDVLDTMAGTVGTTGLDRSGATLVVSDLHPVGVNGSANQLITDDGDGTVTSESTLTYDGSDLKITEAVDDGNPSIQVGGADAESGKIQAVYDSGAQTLEKLVISTATADSGTDAGKVEINVDGTLIATVDDGGIDIASGTNFSINGSNLPTSDTNTTYTAGDGLTLTGTDFDLDAALTTVTSLLATDIKIGEDDQTKVDFETADEIHFYAANVHQVKLVDNAFTPQADSDVDLGASGTYWKDAFIDTITTTGDVDVLGNIELGHASDTTLARSASGTVTIEGDVITTAGVMDMWIPAGAMRAASTNGCADITDVETTATRPDMQVLDFDSSTQEYAQFSIAMPKSWNEGTVTAQFYWTHATAVSTDVIWGIQGVCVKDNDTIDVAYGTAQTVTDTFHNAAEDLAVSAATNAITLAGNSSGSPQAGDLAFFQVYRDADAAGDTTNSTDARLVGVKLMFTTNAANDA